MGARHRETQAANLSGIEKLLEVGISNRRLRLVYQQRGRLPTR
jgi:hypothetical protein